jgi:hypothetical protein
VKWLTAVLLCLSSLPAFAGTATISWTAPTQATDGSPLTGAKALTEYRLYERCGTAGYGSPISLPPTATSAVRSGLPDGTTCYWQVTAVNVDGESARSNEGSKTFSLLLPGEVTNLVITWKAAATPPTGPPDMAAPTFVATATSSYNSAATSKSVSGLTVQVGDLIVVKAVAENAGTTFSTPTATGLATASAFTLEATQPTGTPGALDPRAQLWTATITSVSGGTSFGVDLGSNFSDWYGFRVEVWRDSDGFGTVFGASGDNSAPSATASTTQANSAITYVSTDWNALDGASRTYRTSDAGTFTEELYFHDSSYYTNYAGYHANAGAAGSKTIGLSAPGGQRWALVGIEIKGTTSGTPQTAAPTSDISAGSWTPSTGSTLYGVLDEATRDDADYASVDSNSTMRLGLAALSTPESGPRTLRYAAGGSQLRKLIARLLDSSNATIQSWTTDPLGALTLYERTVTESISSYAGLRVEFETAAADNPGSVAVEYGAIGTGANGTTSCTPSYPSGITSESALYLVVTGRSNTANTEFAAPSDWTLIGSLEGGTGTWGADTGTRRVAIFRKDTVTGSESGTITVTLSGSTNNTMRASIVRVQPPSGLVITESIGTGADTTNDTSYSATSSSNLTFSAGDLMLVATAQNIDTGTLSSVSLTATDVTFGTLSSRSSTAVTSGNDHRHIIYTAPVNSVTGTPNVAPTWSYTISASGSGPTAFLRIRAVEPTEKARVTWVQLEVPEGSGSIELVAGDSAHGHATDGVSLTQAQVLASLDSQHGLVSDSVVLSQGFVLGSQESVHVHAADSPVLSVVVAVSPQDSIHAHVTDGAELTQASIAAPAASVHQHVSDGVGLAQDNMLLALDSIHSHVTDGVQLTQAHVLTTTSSAHQQATDEASLTQAAIAQVAGSAHTQAADGVALSQATPLTVEDSVHAQFVSGLELLQASLLEVADSIHTQVAAGVILTQAISVAVQASVHGHFAEGVNLTQRQVLAALSAAHGHAATQPILSIGEFVQVGDSAHEQAADAASMVQAHYLEVGSAAHVMASAQVALTPEFVIQVADAIHALASDGPQLSAGAALAVASSAHLHLAGIVDLTQAATVIVSDSVHAQIASLISLIRPGEVAGADLLVVSAEGRLFIVAPEERLYRVQ